MKVAVALAAYAALLATGGAWLLRRARWPERAPRLGIVAWQALSVSALASVVMAGAALTVPTVRVSADLADLLQACVMALRAQYSTRGGAAAGATGAALALVVLARAAYCVAGTIVQAVCGRARQREVLTLVGRADAGRDVVVVGHHRPAVYCLPGRHRRIVVTSGALDVLDDAQLAAVLAHERAHLAERHDLVLACAMGLARAFPRVRLFRVAEAETTRLVELLADDVACRRADRLTLAEALLDLAGSPARAAAMSAGGTTAALRVRRLMSPHQPIGPARAGLGSLTAAAVVTLPLLVFAGPAIAATQVDYCPPAGATMAMTDADTGP